MICLDRADEYIFFTSIVSPGARGKTQSRRYDLLILTIVGIWLSGSIMYSAYKSGRYSSYLRLFVKSHKRCRRHDPCGRGLKIGFSRIGIGVPMPQVKAATILWQIKQVPVPAWGASTTFKWSFCQIFPETLPSLMGYYKVLSTMSLSTKPYKEQETFILKICNSKLDVRTTPSNRSKIRI